MVGVGVAPSTRSTSLALTVRRVWLAAVRANLSPTSPVFLAGAPEVAVPTGEHDVADAVGVLAAIEENAFGHVDDVIDRQDVRVRRDLFWCEVAPAPVAGGAVTRDQALQASAALGVELLRSS